MNSCTCETCHCVDTHQYKCPEAGGVGDPMSEGEPLNFRESLQRLIAKKLKEDDRNTQDYICAQFINTCLARMSHE